MACFTPFLKWLGPAHRRAPIVELAPTRHGGVYINMCCCCCRRLLNLVSDMTTGANLSVHAQGERRPSEFDSHRIQPVMPSCPRTPLVKLRVCLPPQALGFGQGEGCGSAKIECMISRRLCGLLHCSHVERRLDSTCRDPSHIHYGAQVRSFDWRT